MFYICTQKCDFIHEGIILFAILINHKNFPNMLNTDFSFRDCNVGVGLIFFFFPTAGDRIQSFVHALPLNYILSP